MKELDIKLHEQWLKDVYILIRGSYRGHKGCLQASTGTLQKDEVFSQNTELGTRGVLQEGVFWLKKVFNNCNNMSNY